MLADTRKSGLNPGDKRDDIYADGGPHQAWPLFLRFNALFLMDGRDR